MRITRNKKRNRKHKTKNRKYKNRKYKGGNINKIAIYFSGRIKSYQNNIDNLINIKNKYNPVFFISINENEESEDIKKFCGIFNITDKQKYFEKLNEPTFLHKYPKRDEVVYYNTYSMWYHNNKAYELIEQYSKDNNIQFNIVLKYRADIKVPKLIEFENPLDNTIYIPEGNDWVDGLNNDMAYGNMDVMKKFSSLVNSIEDICKKGVIFHPETIFKTYINDLNIIIKRFPYSYEFDANRR